MTVPNRHPRHAVHPLAAVSGVVADLEVPAVGLDVSLVDRVQAQLVAQVEERGVVGVVRRPNGVEPPPLHRDDVGAHVLEAHDAASVRVEVVAVDAADQDRPAVHEQLAILDLHPAEPDTALDALHDGPVRRAQHDRERPEGRHLGRPRRDVGHQRLEPDAAEPRRPDGGQGPAPGGEVLERRQGARGAQAQHVVEPPPRRPGIGDGSRAQVLHRGVRHRGCDRLGQSLQRRLDLPPGLEGEAIPAEGHLDRERAGRAVGVEAGVDLDVSQVGRRRRVQEHGAGDAPVPPLVLVLDERGVGPLDDGQPQGVLAGLEGIGQVELRGEVRVLAHADLEAVELDDEHALGRPHVEHDAPPAPRRGHLDGPLVDPGRVLLRHLGWPIGERHLDVGVVRLVERVLHRPAARHLDRSPGVARVVVRPVEELEPPGAVQRQAVEVRDGVHRQAAASRQLGVGPRRGGHGGSSWRRQGGCVPGGPRRVPAQPLVAPSDSPLMK